MAKTTSTHDRAAEMNCRLAAARAIVARLRPASPSAWLHLEQAEFDRWAESLRLAQRRVDELTTSRVT